MEYYDGKFPIIKDNDLYLLRFIQTEKSEIFLNDLKQRFNHYCEKTYFSEYDQDNSEIEDKLCYITENVYFETFTKDKVLYRLGQEKLFHVKVLEKSEINNGTRFAYRYQIEETSYLVAMLEKFLRCSYVDLKGMLQEYFEINPHLLKNQERLLTNDEVLHIIENYISLLDLEDIRTYFIPRMEVSFQKKEKICGNEITWDIPGIEKQPKYHTICKREVQSKEIEQQILKQMLESKSLYGRYTSDGVELLEFSSQDYNQAIYNGHDLETYYSNLIPILLKKIENLTVKENGYQKKKVKEEEYK